MSFCKTVVSKYKRGTGIPCSWSEYSTLVSLLLDKKFRITLASGGTVALLGKKPSLLLHSTLDKLMNPIPNLEGEAGCFCTFAFGTGKNLKVFWSRSITGIQLILVQFEEVTFQKSDLKEFASSITHEIRNPLASIKMVVQTLAQSHGIDERTCRRLSIADREIRTVERVLTAISELFRSPSLVLEPLDAKDLLKQSLQEVQLETNGSHSLPISLQVDVSADLPFVQVDSVRMRLVLVYLVIQTWRWSGYKPLVIQARRAENGVSIDICGISPPVHESARFQKRNSLTIAMVRKIVQDHGGSLSVFPRQLDARQSPEVSSQAKINEHFVYRLFLPVRE